LFFGHRKLYVTIETNVSDVSRLHILPDCSLPFHLLARSRLHPRHHSRLRSMRRTDGLDVPLWLPADHGRQFESQLFHSLAKLCCTQLSRTTTHHPPANGVAERFHRTIKAAIMCHADHHWTEASPGCPWNPHGIQRRPADVVAELVYGELLAPTADPVDPAHLITERRQHMARLRPIPATLHASPATFMHSDLEKCTHVFLRQDATRRADHARSCNGERKQCKSWCAAGPSPCQPTGSSRPAC
jgi:hypothetical protein